MTDMDMWRVKIRVTRVPGRDTVWDFPEGVVEHHAKDLLPRVNSFGKLQIEEPGIYVLQPDWLGTGSYQTTTYVVAGNRELAILTAKELVFAERRATQEAIRSISKKLEGMD